MPPAKKVPRKRARKKAPAEPLCLGRLERQEEAEILGLLSPRKIAEALGMTPEACSMRLNRYKVPYYRWGKVKKFYPPEYVGMAFDSNPFEPVDEDLPKCCAAMVEDHGEKSQEVLEGLYWNAEDDQGRPGVVSYFPADSEIALQVTRSCPKCKQRIQFDTRFRVLGDTNTRELVPLAETTYAPARDLLGTLEEAERQLRMILAAKRMGTATEYDAAATEFLKLWNHSTAQVADSRQTKEAG